MQKIKAFLFPRHTGGRGFSLLLLAMRVLFGALLMSHGIQKASNFATLAAGTFPDPLGMGSDVSVSLAIFGELVCPLAFIAGLLYRLSMIPMTVTMAVAFLSVHSGSVADGELAFVYLTVFIIMYVAGPGKYSVDGLIAKKIFPATNNKYNTTTWRKN